MASLAAVSGQLIRPITQGNRSRHPSEGKLVLRLAGADDRNVIYRMRHDVYSVELRQHEEQPHKSLSDPLDASNVYILATSGDEIVGFISITPPGGRYSIDKYFIRSELPFQVDDRLYEVRLLSVAKAHRRGKAALALMYAAYRWIHTNGGTRIVAIGRTELAEMYLKAGLQRLFRRVRSGQVTFELMTASVADLRILTEDQPRLLRAIEHRVTWALPIPFRSPAGCFHGGAFWDAIGPDFSALERRRRIINADVLDAWFPPSPKVLELLRRELPWLVQTSPPTACEGLLETIACVRGVQTANLLPGAGSSDLMFLALRQWLTPRSRALILDPTYGEYAHILERVIGCCVDRLILDRGSSFQLSLPRLLGRLDRGYDLIVLVNPNSPTGQLVPGRALQEVLRCAPQTTRIWIDETYIDYAGVTESLERFATTTSNLVVCKSMSKAYALSGLRVAYLCGGASVIDDLRTLTPPWAVGLPGQVAAVAALNDPDYYAERYDETRRLRDRLADDLKRDAGVEVISGVANSVLCLLPAGCPTAAEIVQRCKAHGLYVRDAASMSRRIGSDVLRIAVKDRETNLQIVHILQKVLRSS